MGQSKGLWYLKIHRIVHLAFLVFILNIYGFAMVGPSTKKAQEMWDTIDTITISASLYASYLCVKSGSCVVVAAIIMTMELWNLYLKYIHLHYTSIWWKIPSSILMMAWGYLALLHLR
jgi:uncharacterized membrane protein